MIENQGKEVGGRTLGAIDREITGNVAENIIGNIAEQQYC